jgi:hypothetical protein
MSEHLGQNILTLDVDSSSDTPIGRTFYLSQSTRGQNPKDPSKYFSFIKASPLGDIINLAWIRPYKSIAD